MEYLPPGEIYKPIAKKLNLKLSDTSYYERLFFMNEDCKINISLYFEENNLIVKGISEKDNLPLSKNIVDEVISVIKNWNEGFPTIRLDFQLNVSIKSEVMTFAEDSIQKQIWYEELNKERKKEERKEQNAISEQRVKEKMTIAKEKKERKMYQKLEKDMQKKMQNAKKKKLGKQKLSKV
jgi:hypothetical protein